MANALRKWKEARLRVSGEPEGVEMLLGTQLPRRLEPDVHHEIRPPFNILFGAAGAPTWSELEKRAPVLVASIVTTGYYIGFSRQMAALHPVYADAADVGIGSSKGWRIE